MSNAAERPQQRARREPYPVATMLRARELRDAGWYQTDIRRILEAEGLGSPSLFTIQVWTNQRYYHQQRELVRSRGAKRSAKTAAFRLAGSSDAYTQAFMEQLRKDGVPSRSIAKVCRRVIAGFDLSEDQVRERLRGTGRPHGNERPRAGNPR